MNPKDKVVFDSVARLVGLPGAPPELEEFLPGEGLFTGKLMIIGILILIAVSWFANRRMAQMDDLGGGPL